MKLYQKQQNVMVINKWVQQVSIAGFSFFFIKGLVWVAIAVWAVY